MTQGDNLSGPLVVSGLKRGAKFSSVVGDSALTRKVVYFD